MNGLIFARVCGVGWGFAHRICTKSKFQQIDHYPEKLIGKIPQTFNSDKSALALIADKDLAHCNDLCISRIHVKIPAKILHIDPVTKPLQSSRRLTLRLSHRGRSVEPSRTKGARMSNYTKVYETRQYTEVVYYKDGEEIARDTRFDDHLYDDTGHEPMTQDEIEDWGWDD